MDLSALRPKDYTNIKKKLGQKHLVIFWEKNYNCDFSVLRIISQLKFWWVHC